MLSSHLLWFADNKIVSPAATMLMGARVQYLRVHWEGHALCRVQGKKEEDNSVFRHQERAEIPEAEGAPGGALSPCSLLCKVPFHTHGEAMKT
jgi:hypothetical protein